MFRKEWSGLPLAVYEIKVTTVSALFAGMDFLPDIFGSRPKTSGFCFFLLLTGRGENRKRRRRYEEK